MTLERRKLYNLGEGSGSGTSTVYGFVGSLGVRDDNTRLSLMGARYYDPIIGRFMSRDSLRNTNRYIYCANNPINMIDPLGLQGLNVSADVIFVGRFSGTTDQLSGFTVNYNYTFWLMSYTRLTDPQTGKQVGWTLGVGPSAPLIGFSISGSNTQYIPLIKNK